MSPVLTNPLIRFACFAAIFVFATPGFAQEGVGEAEGATGPAIDAAPETGEPGGLGPFQLQFQPYVAHLFESDFKNAGGNISTTGVGGDLGIRYKFAEDWEFSLTTSVEYRDYDTSGIAAALGVGSEPFDDMLAITVRPGVTYSINDQWAVFGGAVFNWFGETGVDASDAFTGGGYLGARYAVSKDLVFIGGFSVVSELDEDARVTPILGVRWQATDDVLVDITGSRLGVAAKVGYDFAEDWTVFGTLRYQRNRFRLDTSSSLPNGVLQDRFITVGAGVSWTPEPFLSLNFEVGAVVDREVRLNNSRRIQVFEQQVDPGAYIALGATLKF